MKQNFLLLIFAVLLTVPLIAKDRQNEIDETIQNLEEEIKELEEKLPGLSEKATDLVQYSRKKLTELQNSENNQNKIEFHRRMINILQNNYQDGLSRTSPPGILINQEFRDWMKSRDMTIGWGNGGLDQFSVLAGIYYTKKGVSNRRLLISLLQSNREYGISKDKYEWYKRDAPCKVN